MSRSLLVSSLVCQDTLFLSLIYFFQKMLFCSFQGGGCGLDFFCLVLLTSTASIQRSPLGCDSSAYEDHKYLCFLILSVQNVSSGFNSATKPPPTNFLNMFHYILKFISNTQTLHVWSANELRMVTNFILRYLDIYHGTAHQFSQSNAFLIQKILSNTNLFFTKTRSLELRYLHILQHLSACYNFPTCSIHYLNQLVRQYPADFFVSKLSYSSCRNNLAFSRKHTTHHT